MIVDRLTKTAHFLPIKKTYSTDRLGRLYVNRIVCLYGVPVSIVSDRGSTFTLVFWQELHKALGTILDFSTAFHPQTDGQFERTIQTLEDMLRMCVMDFGGQWDLYLPLMEFAYNNSYHASIEMAPYEALYGRKCRSLLYWEIGERQLTGPELVQVTSERVPIIQQRLKTTFSRQKSYAGPKRKDVSFPQETWCFLKCLL